MEKINNYPPRNPKTVQKNMKNWKNYRTIAQKSKNGTTNRIDYFQNATIAGCTHSSLHFQVVCCRVRVIGK